MKGVVKKKQGMSQSRIKIGMRNIGCGFFTDNRERIALSGIPVYQGVFVSVNLPSSILIKNSFFWAS